MLGLFSTLNLGARALQAQQTAIEVTGQNLANVNNSAYARQRVQIQSSATVPTAIGPQGTGVDTIAINQLRSDLVDGQIRNEASVGGYWEAQQSALQNAQASLGEYLNISTDGASSGSLGTSGLADKLNGLFDAFQSVATSPESISERQNLIAQAQSVAGTFNNISVSLSNLHDALNNSLTSDANSANQLLTSIANLNNQITNAESAGNGKANDLRDLREQKLEDLSKLVSFDSSTGTDGSVNISISGSQLVSGGQVTDTLENNIGRIRTVNSQTVLTLSGGAMQGTIDARDGTVQTLQNSLDSLARILVIQVNDIHVNGYNLAGGNGNIFFTGINAGNIGVNPAMVADPSLFQASGAAGSPGDNTIALQLAQTSRAAGGWISGGPSYIDYYGEAVAQFGNAVQKSNNQLADHDVVNTLLLKQRESVSGVSIDEEMTNLITFQKAYQASAKIVTTVDQMLSVVINMKQ